jgi:hypothetical protein
VAVAVKKTHLFSGTLLRAKLLKMKRVVWKETVGIIRIEFYARIATSPRDLPPLTATFF